jgi:hypothetical protein
MAWPLGPRPRRDSPPSSSKLYPRFPSRSIAVPIEAGTDGRELFFLVSGVLAGVEGTLGTDSEGVDRPNDHPCP